ncbi:elicitor-responsive protein 3-like [Asparagus officinalis]|uniref:elicitor-responsive protein 3-like n=1 Tax=Asparagus officinalis TaxID=4686 RepID=UPI00098E1920|nr:elicitor-responsive protein 3-like [Asparagus officinalis]
MAERQQNIFSCFNKDRNEETLGFSFDRSIDRNRSGEAMVRGTLQVLLVGAKGLEDADFFGGMDPYAILTCRTQEQRSSTATGKGCNPEWNETFVFTVSDNVPEITIKLMDSDTLSEDDLVGKQCKICLEPLFMEGSLPPTVYNVVKDQEYRGEIKVALTFTPAEDKGEGEDYGGWGESS